MYLETFRGFPATISVESGGQYYGDPRRNRPPRYFHLTVTARHLGAQSAATWVHPRLPPASRGDAVRSDTGRAELVSRPSWFGTAGSLILTRTHDLAFRWRVGAAGYEMALHAWAPFREAAPTLRVLAGRALAAPPFPPPSSSPVTQSGHLRWIAPPRWVADACASVPRLAGICPRTLPLARSRFISAFVAPRAIACPEGRRDLVSVQWSAEDAAHPRRNRPPRFLHFEVSAGPGCLRFHFPHAPVAPRPGMMLRRDYGTSAPVPLGRYAWGGHHGLLVLGDCFGNHLCFRWRAHGTSYQVDLHGWEPFPETVTVLRRIVASAGS